MLGQFFLFVLVADARAQRSAHILQVRGQSGHHGLGHFWVRMSGGPRLLAVLLDVALDLLNAAIAGSFSRHGLTPLWAYPPGASAATMEALSPYCRVG